MIFIETRSRPVSPPAGSPGHAPMGLGPQLRQEGGCVEAADSCAGGCDHPGARLEPPGKSTFAALLGIRAAGGVDLTTAYRYNQNMMEYYTCKMGF